MTTMTTRASKGAALTHNELDDNFKRDTQTKAADYTVVEADNRSVIEVTATATITLPDAATIAAASDTGDFEVTIKNLAGTTTIGRVTGADTIDGTAADIDLTTVDSVTLKVNQAGNGYNIVAGGVSVSGKILTSPVINTPVINADSEGISSGGQSVYGMVVLDTPELIVNANTATNSWQTYNTASNTLKTNSAKKAIIRAHIDNTIISATTAVVIGLSIRKTGTSVTIPQGRIAYDHDSNPVSGTLVSDAAGEGIVNLDANNEFDWYHETNATSTSWVNLYLVGYYV